ncbi:hypothetical protein HUE87_07690 [Candidatus Sulfurimonas marisnigri]|uniref:Uncharacterized protein n=1 Tax=Candidatus Sulfurimonas marisnigri TaxID=2740405 RepID=A0A7S7LYL1_9BACT|nr:hypothetical protein [Candidatus Sulfurimonas marisnigri]QOY53782.1 hypothetical protein HUE87_07690 [Candidatus Sulfurimonas marisnigri]
MDDEIIYSIVGIITLIFVIMGALRGKSSQEPKTKEQKRAEIVAAYKLELQESLDPLSSNKDAKIAKKTSLLKKFSDELSRNIFFDKNEIRDIILELAR